MKCVILAGGYGTRISEFSDLRPKPMIEVGGQPILWHVMKHYSRYGVNEFVICLGYKAYMIKEYFANYSLHMSDVTFDMRENEMTVHNNQAEPWKVTVVDTGADTMTGGRLKRVAAYLGDEDFCFTYGDGVGDVDIDALVAFHKSHGKLATVTAVQPPGRFGSLDIDGDRIIKFQEKPAGDGGWINGGFFVLSPDVLKYVDGDDTVWEEETLPGLVDTGELMAYRHHGFWHAMDTLRDKLRLDRLWESGEAPWKTWE